MDDNFSKLQASLLTIMEALDLRIENDLNNNDFISAIRNLALFEMLCLWHSGDIQICHGDIMNDIINGKRTS